MDENQKSIDGIIEKLALITEATENIFPNGKTVMIFELGQDDFKRVQNNFRTIDRTHNQFKINISGTEFIFLEKSLIDEISTISETPEQPVVRKDTFFGRLKNLLRKGSQTSSD
jgi:hypothetical protein